MADQRRARQSAKGTDQRPLLLRHVDQAVVGGIVALSLVGMAAYFVVQGGFRGGLIEIDRAGPLEARFRVDVNQAQWSAGTRSKFVKSFAFQTSQLPVVSFDHRATPGVNVAQSLLAEWLAVGPQHCTVLFARACDAGARKSSLHRARVPTGLASDAGFWSLA